MTARSKWARRNRAAAHHPRLAGWLFGCLAAHRETRIGRFTACSSIAGWLKRIIGAHSFWIRGLLPRRQSARPRPTKIWLMRWPFTSRLPRGQMLVAYRTDGRLTKPDSQAPNDQAASFVHPARSSKGWQCSSLRFLGANP